MAIEQDWGPIYEELQIKKFKKEYKDYCPKSKSNNIILCPKKIMERKYPVLRINNYFKNLEKKSKKKKTKKKSKGKRSKKEKTKRGNKKTKRRNKKTKREKKKTKREKKKTKKEKKETKRKHRQRQRRNFMSYVSLLKLFSNLL